MNINKNKNKNRGPATVAGILIVAIVTTSLAVGGAAAQDQSPKDRVAALQASLASSAENLRTYEWIETLSFNLKGEEKARKQSRCYYGADGGLQKVEENKDVDEGRKKRGLRGKVQENKKDDLADYIARVADLIKGYVPPDPAKLQSLYGAGKVSLDVMEPGKRARLNFKDYLKPGDHVSLEINLTNNTLLGLTVKSYMENTEDVVSMSTKFDKLNDGTTYPTATVVEAPKKEIKVVVDNAGYRKMAG